MRGGAGGRDRIHSNKRQGGGGEEKPMKSGALLRYAIAGILK